MTESTLKRKQPPTFRHLPLNRAKKLKQSWVENKKIKSKWKAQRRKEGLSTTPIVETSRSGDGDEESDAGHSGSESGEQEEIDQSSELEEKPTPKKSTLHPSRAHIHPELSSKDSHKRRKVDEDQPAPAPPPSLRELSRQAYSRSSLHTFKADQGRRGGARGGGRERGGLRGRGGQRGETGRGQPNMKLRMDAMLEKIKQTVG
ncbi:hypothetical protein D9615_001892 [Tricholomella constricta]|uniref:rRNA-processing protein FYV7 n=1 Tax=Tricholomella constricta TaxID=117010 RepID=A0A8H5HNL1_9AGAR|nr:hypothetical protein D9615_001892 [Tricholomella constricta]